MEFLTGYLLQIVSTVGVVFIFGSIIALLRRAFCAVAGRSGPKILLVTGIIGTPIHELSHALMCLVFGHKIKDIKLYQPRSNDGTLGYVSHTYNKKNIYHQIGNFFIGTAPVVVGGGLTVLILRFMLPDSFSSIFGEIELLSKTDIGSFPIVDFLKFIFYSVKAIFAPENFASWQGWVFLFLAIMISTHMEMSTADIKNSMRGLIFLLILLLLTDGATYLISKDAFAAVNEATFSFGLMISAFLIIPILFLTALLAVAIIFNAILRLFTR